MVVSFLGKVFSILLSFYFILTCHYSLVAFLECRIVSKTTKKIHSPELLFGRLSLFRYSTFLKNVENAKHEGRGGDEIFKVSMH